MPKTTESILDLTSQLAGFKIHLEAANRSPHTLAKYLMVARQLIDFLRARGMPTATASVHREHVESFIADTLESGLAAATANTRYQALRVFFAYLVDEGEITASPMERMKPPIVPEVLVPVVDDELLRRILKGCSGRDFEGLRDAALFRLFAGTGPRLSEVAGMRVEDIDFNYRVTTVLGKGRRPRTVPFSPRTGQALVRYLKARSRHPLADSPDKGPMWLGLRGPLTPSGIRQMVWRRSEAAGQRIHPHQLRHTFAHTWLADGGGETDLMMLAGWRSRSMLSRYGRSAAEERAIAAHHRSSLTDRF
jgi:site-specific recombinase XerC